MHDDHAFIGAAPKLWFALYFHRVIVLRHEKCKNKTYSVSAFGWSLQNDSKFQSKTPVIKGGK